MAHNRPVQNIDLLGPGVSFTLLQYLLALANTYLVVHAWEATVQTNQAEELAAPL